MNSPGTVRRAATARERARAELTREIKEEARRQLLATGADGLSLRAVAKELGMVSSALYRYYPSRDDLLTALIVDAYNALGAAAEHALAGPAPARERWIAACHAIRDWARSNPHEYALVYGSPVPGYRAPDATIGPASRVPLAFAGVVREALATGELAAPREALPVTGELAGQAAALSAALAASAASPESSRCVRECPAGRACPCRDRVDAAVRDDQLRAVRPVRRVVRAGRRALRVHGRPAHGLRRAP